MLPLAQRVLIEIRRQELLKAGDRVGVAVSGGIDSVALLRIFLELSGELGIVLSVVHFNHKLRSAESDADEKFVADLARAHGLQFLCGSDNVAEHASREGVSLEAAARKLRYGFFRSLLDRESTSGADDRNSHPGVESAVPPKNPPHEPKRAKLDKVATGHTLDDQAETVLLRIIRGSGLSGLGGIHPRIALENENGDSSGQIVRPLLSIRRRELEQCLHAVGQAWREDSTNSDHAFTRNRLRKLVIPVLEEEFNPAVAESLSELAEIARGEEEYWENEVAGWMGTAVHWVEPDWVHPTPALVQISPADNRQAPESDSELQARIDNAPWLVANASVSRPWFLTEPIAVQRRAVKAIGDQAGIPLEFKHVEQILRFAAVEPHSGRELTLPLGWKLTVSPEEIRFVTPELRETRPRHDYEHEITVPGRAILPEIGILIEALSIPAEKVSEYNPDELLDADSLPGRLRVRNWRAGDRFWPAHTKSPKKIKELLQEHRVAQPDRACWPIVLAGDEVIWVQGFATHAKLGAKPGRSAVMISDRRWPEGK